jgi:sulfoxide reductase heme-binding subunit YedZ
MAGTTSTRRRASFLVFTACGLPLALGIIDAVRGRLGANPIAEVLNRLGFWTLTFLLLALAPTPLRIVLGWSWPLRYRRMIGLFAFFYAFLHLAAYVGLDQFFDFAAIVEDVVKRKFITLGMVAFALLVPLAVTSTNRAVRRLGFVRWKRLHRLAYVAAACGVVHFAWRVKADLRQPALFGGALGVLLLIRLFAWYRTPTA